MPAAKKKGRAALAMALLLIAAFSLSAESPGPDWLKANVDAPGFLPKLLEYAFSLGDPYASVKVLEAFSALPKDLAVREAILGKKASLEELLGLYSDAASSLALSIALDLDPAGEGPSPEALTDLSLSEPRLLLKIASLSLLSGNGARATSLALSLAASKEAAIVREARILIAMALLAQARTAEAEKELLALLASYPEAKPRLYRILAHIDSLRGKESPWAKAPLKDYPDSPEALSLASGLSQPFPSAFWVLGTGLASSFTLPPAAAPVPMTIAPTTSAPTTSAPTASVPTTSAPTTSAPAVSPKAGSFLQIGSFSVLANAESLALSLKAKGFKAESRSISRSGKTYWIVVIPVDALGSGSMASKLKDLGFESFMISLP